MNNNGFNNGTNNGQVFANSDYTVNTESLVGKPSSYFQNNNTSNISGSNTSGWSGNANNLNSTATGGFNQNTNLGTNPSFTTTPTPWSTTTAIPTPWDNGVTYPQQMTTPTP